jgi:hypothetical protein
MIVGRLLSIASPFLNVDPPQLRGDVIHVAIREDPGIAGPAARLDLPGTEQVFDAMDGYPQPPGDFPNGGDNGNRTHVSLSRTVCPLPGATYTESVSGSPKGKA